MTSNWTPLTIFSFCKCGTCWNRLMPDSLVYQLWTFTFCDAHSSCFGAITFKSIRYACIWNLLDGFSELPDVDVAKIAVKYMTKFKGVLLSKGHIQQGRQWLLINQWPLNEASTSIAVVISEWNLIVNDERDETVCIVWIVTALCLP